MVNGACTQIDVDRRRVFWSTQPTVDERQACGATCGVPGLLIENEIDSQNCRRCQTFAENVPAPEDGQDSTIVTSSWVRGLVLNILMTNGRYPNTNCGRRPGSMGGHWSESFAGSGASFGNLMYSVPSGYRINDLVKLASQYVRAAMQKLVTYGVAKNVDVETNYKGGGVVSVDIIIQGTNGLNENVGVSGSIVDNYWVWQS